MMQTSALQQTVCLRPSLKNITNFPCFVWGVKLNKRKLAGVTLPLSWLRSWGGRVGVKHGPDQTSAMSSVDLNADSQCHLLWQCSEYSQTTTDQVSFCQSDKRGAPSGAEFLIGERERRKGLDLDLGQNS